MAFDFFCGGAAAGGGVHCGGGAGRWAEAALVSSAWEVDYRGLRTIDLCWWRFGSVSRRRIPDGRVWIDRRRIGGERSAILQAKVQGEIGISAIASGAALHCRRQIIGKPESSRSIVQIDAEMRDAEMRKFVTRHRVTVSPHQALIRMGFPQRPQNLVPAG